MREQHATAQPIHAAAVRRVIAEIKLGIDHRALPLADISFAMNFERLGQRLKQLGRGALIAAATRNGDREFTVVRKIDFSGQRDVAILGRSGIPSPF